jgi:hypothetical protein
MNWIFGAEGTKKLNIHGEKRRKDRVSLPISRYFVKLLPAQRQTINTPGIFSEILPLPHD